uniref:Uncharacterized protein n=1 Tax=Rhizophora mucronata TaxID=61149 RepID=A0A2P2N1H1_RHIMU
MCLAGDGGGKGFSKTRCGVRVATAAPYATEGESFLQKKKGLGV